MAAASLNQLGIYDGTIVGNLVVAADGTIYGAATNVAGTNASTVFAFSAGIFTNLGTFDYATTGSGPAGGLAIGPGSLLYTTSYYGGTYDYGTVDTVSSTSPLTTIAAMFPPPPSQMAEGPPVVDAAGNVFFAGGGNGIYEVAAGTHLVTLFASVAAYGSLAIDAAGNIYGTTGLGAFGYGSVFEVSPLGTVTTLEDFNGTNGNNSVGGLVMDAAGNLYGNAHNLFEIAAGTHAYTVLANFADGGGSETNQIAVAADGTIYGTTNGPDGSVYELAAGSHSVTTLIGDTGDRLGGLTTAPDGVIFGTSNGDEIVQLVLCFLAGTAIATPAGETAIEALRHGDLVMTADGRALPIRWIGIHTVSPRFADPLRYLPIRIMAGALGEAVPHRDLLVSPDHAMFLDGVLVQANALVDGVTVRRETAMSETFRYYHIEVEDHSLILAEGAATETFVDNADRMAFDNWQEHLALFPEAPPIPEMPYPRVRAARQIPDGIRVRLNRQPAAAVAA